MTVIPLDLHTRRAAKKARDILLDHSAALARLLHFVGGETALESFDAALDAIAGAETDVPALREALDRMSAVLEGACCPDNRWNGVLLSYGGLLTELRYDL